MAHVASIKRPSRLLNLNKASASRKRVSANNVSHSPLLSLPPEIRSRIWDYVFQVGVIHVTVPERHRVFGYDLSICHHPDEDEKTPGRILVSQLPGSQLSPRLSDERASMQDHQGCVFDTKNRRPLNQDLHLDLLQTCRSVYHEAVLKPFSINDFQCISKGDSYRNALLNLATALVPAQIRAIKTLHLISIDTSFARRSVIKQLQGLEHLTIQAHLFFGMDLSSDLEFLLNRDGVAALSDLSLKSLHISMRVQSNTLHLTNADVDALSAQQQEMENKLLNRAKEHEGLDR
ncbi:hypothetical protein E2P81_ATG10165 [Venturia nashicola]|nr:hypothetical protein E2P81_ATG10165 [Venturia nashicola]